MNWFWWVLKMFLFLCVLLVGWGVMMAVTEYKQLTGDWLVFVCTWVKIIYMGIVPG